MSDAVFYILIGILIGIPIGGVAFFFIVAKYSDVIVQKTRRYVDRKKGRL